MNILKNVGYLLVVLFLASCTPAWTPTFTNPKPLFPKSEADLKPDADTQRELRAYADQQKFHSQVTDEMIRRSAPDFILQAMPEVAGYTPKSCKENAPGIAKSLQGIMTHRSPNYCTIAVDRYQYYSPSRGAAVDRNNRAGIFLASCACHGTMTVVDNKTHEVMDTYDPATGKLELGDEASNNMVNKLLNLYILSGGAKAEKDAQREQDEQDIRDWITGRTNKEMFKQQP